MAGNYSQFVTATTTAQNVTLSADWQTVDVINIDGGGVVYCRADGVTAVQAAADCDVVVGAGGFVSIATPGNTTVISIIASATTKVAVVGRTA